MAVIRIPDLLVRQADLRPDSTAMVVDGVSSITFLEWLRDSRAVAVALRARLPVRTFVGLLFEPTEWVAYAIAYVGCQLGGMIPVTLHARFREVELAKIYEQIPVRLLVRGAHWPTPSSLPVMTVDELKAEAAAVGVTLPTRLSPIADVILTTGTTGMAKPVVSYHAELLARGGLPPALAGRTLVHTMPPSSASGTQGAMLLALRGGLTCSAVPSLDMDHLIRRVADPSTAVLYLTPWILLSLVKRGSDDRSAPTYEHVQMLMLLGAATPGWALAWAKETFSRAAVLTVYGLTEGGGAHLLMPYNPRRPDSAGKPFGRTRVRIMSGARLAKAGEVGEVELRRVGARQRNYLADPTTTRGVFLRGGWVRTGDLGYLDSDGYLFIVDRIKDVINRAGQKVSSFEVESALLQHPRVGGVAVFATDDSPAGELVVAAVVRAGPVTTGELRAYLASRLASYKVPSHFWFVEELQRNQMGKVDKRQMHVLFAASRPSRLDGRPAVEPTVSGQK